MQTFLRAFCERAADAKPGSPLSFVASTSGLARDGLVIDPNAWQLDNYQRSPVVLWSHDYMGNHPPIGRADNVRVEGGKLLADITFDSADPFAAEIERKYRDGFLNAVSVGWDTIEMAVSSGNDAPRVTKAELLDISAVNVPGDPDALVLRQKRAYADMGLALLQVADVIPVIDVETEEIDPKNGCRRYRVKDDSMTVTLKPIESSTDPATERASWDETSAAMVRTFRPHAQRPDAERKTEYQRLARDYARHGKTPPEFLTQDELDAYDGATLRGLFLEGETELHAAIFAGMESRAGAVLSQRNQADLEQAVSLIQGVVGRAKKEAESSDNEAERALIEAVAKQLGVAA